MNASPVPAAFGEALSSLAGAKTRRDVRLVETPAPSRIAPFAVAINGTVLPEELETSGRFVLLHNPAGEQAWRGDFRVVALVQAQADAEVGSDDLWADAAWSWLREALEPVPHRELSGTVTKIVNRAFGDSAVSPDEVTVEMRVSWTPLDSKAGDHIIAWTELLAMCAGIPPVPDGVSVLPRSTA